MNKNVIVKKTPFLFFFVLPIAYDGNHLIKNLCQDFSNSHIHTLISMKVIDLDINIKKKEKENS
jgi:hypothetical protein